MAYREFTDLARKTTFDKVLRDEAINIVVNPKYECISTWTCLNIFFLKKSLQIVLLHVQINLLSKVELPNRQLAIEIHKPIITKFEKRKVHSYFRENIWGADHAYMLLISNYNKGLQFLLHVTDIFSKYA